MDTLTRHGLVLALVLVSLAAFAAGQPGPRAAFRRWLSPSDPRRATILLVAVAAAVLVAALRIPRAHQALTYCERHGGGGNWCVPENLGVAGAYLLLAIVLALGLPLAARAHRALRPARAGQLQGQ